MVSAILYSVPKYVICSPIRSISDKVQRLAQISFGYILRIAVFQLGTLKTRGAAYFIRTYQYFAQDKGPFDIERLFRSKKLLIEFGGIEATVFPADGKAEIKCMTFRSSDFFAYIEQLGGCKEIIQYEGEERTVIIPTPNKNSEHLFSKLQKFHLPLIDIGSRQAILLPPAPILEPNQVPPFILRSHSPGRSMYTERRFLGQHLATGYDVCLWDPRGTIESLGTASEGGYYLDLAAVFDHMVQLKVPPHRIYLSGYCEGAGVNAYIKKEYHDRGVHFIAENPFHNLLSVVKHVSILGQLFGSFAFPELQAKDPAIKSRVNQDGFDIEAKFSNLPVSEGKFILIHTNTDRCIPKNAIQRLRASIGNAGPYIEIERIHPNPKIDGHMQPPTEDLNVWRRYIEVVC